MKLFVISLLLALYLSRESCGDTDQPECDVSDCVCDNIRCITEKIQKSTIENELKRCCKLYVQNSQGHNRDPDECTKREGFFNVWECSGRMTEKCRRKTFVYFLNATSYTGTFFHRVRQRLTLPASEDGCDEYVDNYIEVVVDVCKSNTIPELQATCYMYRTLYG
uniref:Venom protein n=1 Tax=Hadrurus spadix TaxID=141984 RepID=A0A1W7R919_9SCOR